MAISKPITFFIVVYTSLSFAQIDTTKTQEYLKAFEALQKKDTTTAITLFKKSIGRNNDAPSYYELSKIYWQKKDFLLRNKAYENMKMAVMKDEKNIEYKYFYADICQYFARFESINQWKEIVAIDSTQIQAWINLAEFSGKEFAEWDKSVRQFIIPEISPIIPPMVISLQLQEEAVKDFAESVNFYNHATRIDSTNYALGLSAGLFYAKNNMPLLGLKHVKRLERLNRADKNVYQCLGLLYYKSNNLKDSFLAYQKALEKMTDNEREDFTLNSVRFILSTGNSKLKELNKVALRSYLDTYWKSNDPIIMTEYNERLLEHYSRVAFANLSFSIPQMNVVGWKSDRGEMVLRYGEPLYRIRIRLKTLVGMKNELEKENRTGKNDLMATNVKADIWGYQDFSIRFVDPWFTGNYQFAPEQLISLENYRKNNPTTFYPKFNGPIFNLPYQSYQFSSKNKAQTDIYLSYGIDFSDTTTTKEKFSGGYDVGLFMFDGNFNKKYQNKKTITDINTPTDFSVNSLQITSTPLNGNLAFEVERKKDKGVTAYHGKYIVKDYSGNDLKMSDIVLASQVEVDEEINGSIKRNDISILPNPTKSFTKDNKLFLYYEVYNLKKNTYNTTDFEQKITIQKKEEGGILNSMLSVIGLDKEGKKVTLTTKYQTQEKDPQMYLQLDMSKYEPGKYVVTVTIKDSITGKETNSQAEVNWN